MGQTEWTILALIRWADERFKKEGMATPRLDAEVLLAETLATDRVALYTHFDQPLQPDELARFKELIRRRLRREPVAYILGKREFWSLPLRVTPDVLIPRPETETLVAEALKILTPAEGKDFHILEIGTGSGAISIALARELPATKVVATDLSPKALAVAEENALRSGVRERIRFLQGDLFHPLEKGETFNLIVTNPPYIPRGQFPSLLPEVRDYEPKVALDGGKDGLDFFRRVLPAVDEYLLPGGWFLAEMGAGQDPQILKIAEKNPDLDSFTFAKDLGGINRVFKARKRVKDFHGTQMNTDEHR
ncbi:MAG: peptide chain release factor N(5)-glutamine methyltransferase [Deltaproteobacteria bacterium]|nr:peptide chain release factor N(5)-glutamine methyltransferase [Deltaproteobacteria bacterium]